MARAEALPMSPSLTLTPLTKSLVSHALPCHVMPCHFVSCCVMSCCVLSCHAMICCIVTFPSSSFHLPPLYTTHPLLHHKTSLGFTTHLLLHHKTSIHFTTISLSSTTISHHPLPPQSLTTLFHHNLSPPSFTTHPPVQKYHNIDSRKCEAKPAFHKVSKGQYHEPQPPPPFNNYNDFQVL